VDVSEGSGSVGVNGSTSSSYPVDYAFNTETKVKLEAIPASGYRFFQWGGYIVTNENPVIINIDCSQTITVKFSSLSPVLTMKEHGQGYIYPSTGNHNYSQEDQIIMTAYPDRGWKFDGWSNNVDNPHSPITSLTLKSDTTVIAYFSRILPVWLLPTAIVSDVIIIGTIGWLLFRKRPHERSQL
jgi:hypothetical protein